jgi:hypothetical protein
VTEALAPLKRATAPYLVPGGDGSVQVEWHEKNGEIELDIAADGTLEIWVLDRLSRTEIEGQHEEALALFSRWAPRVAAIGDNENHVLFPANTAILAAVSGLSIYKNDIL